MEQKNQGKITIQQGTQQGENLAWSEILGEKEYLYFGEAKEAVEMITWHTAEEICNRKLEASPAILIKPWRKTEDNEWKSNEERVLLLFDDK